MKSVILDSRTPKKAKEKLLLLGYKLIELPPSRHLPEGISAHSDSLICKLGREIITFVDYCDEAAYVFSDIREYAPHLSIFFSSDAPRKVYPSDAKYNALIMGKRLFARLESLSETIKDKAIKSGYELINVKQGYPACATLVLDDTHAITSDRGLCKTLCENGIEVTLIETGSIALPPYEYGFIGGAAGVCDGNVYFVGDYKTHPSAAAIEEAVKSVGLKPISLTDGLLTDVGGLLFLNDT